MVKSNRLSLETKSFDGVTYMSLAKDMDLIVIILKELDY